MKKALIRSVVIDNKKLNHKFNLLKFKFSDNVSFKQGQFIILKITDSISRCYSISSSPDTLPFWEIFVDITPGGPGTSYIKKLKKKDTVETSLPTGTFIHHRDGSKNIILAGTGCGIAPLLPILKETLKDNTTKRIILFWGLRFKKDIVLNNHLNNLKKKYPKFHYEIILSKPEEKWSKKTGHIQKYILESIKTTPHKETSVYLSGNGEFIKETLDELKKAKHPLARLYMEKCY